MEGQNVLHGVGEDDLKILAWAGARILREKQMVSGVLAWHSEAAS